MSAGVLFSLDSALIVVSAILCFAVTLSADQSLFEYRRSLAIAVRQSVLMTDQIGVAFCADAVA